jgi:hypothetical protein
MTQPEKRDHPLLKAMGKQGHTGQILKVNTTTEYLEASCTRCTAKAWGWYTADGRLRRQDLDGPSVTSPCPQ